ncbi:nitric oxide reductase activation protein NorD [Thiohalophilus sp.]|uniref:nitric oxide reductase activation protein NorD n=1 Tax=Thiohalophilus sp. TaxID=3028392 RepID=UPI002ACE7B3D|nr:VWA domain-containing protein [Thiohalophilus sp.]MDZ7660869.1 VWA domain-containing protein [Thiohalophilus sp.]
MEEFVGKLWHRFITRSAQRSYPEQAVTLAEVSKTIGILFRAAGGEGGLRIEATSASEHEGRRSLLERIAGSGDKIELCWRTEESLFLPARVDAYPERHLNRDLYLWLAALAAEYRPTEEAWFTYSQWLTRQVLQRYPGLAARYRRLVEAELARRPEPSSLPRDEAAREQAIRTALSNPGELADLPEAGKSPQPVLLWLHPAPPRAPDRRSGQQPAQDDLPEAEGEVEQLDDERRHRAEQVDMPDGDKGLVLDRFENILSWAEYVKVDRSTEEDDDIDSAQQTLDDMEVVSVARDSKSTAKRLRFDLDLPGEDDDDRAIGEGIRLPEWDYRKQEWLADHCCVLPMIAADAPACELPEHLLTTARRLKKQFESLVPQRVWFNQQSDGSEIDLHAYLEYSSERLRGQAMAEQRLYRDFRGGRRDLSCLLLADLSLSTDTWVNNESRVIDIIRDSLMLFSEALSASGDRFAIYGFSSRYRDHVRFHTIKTFAEKHNAAIRGRINVIKPGFYTRMGTAIRQATRTLGKQVAHDQLLLILTDGKPNDLDHYEGRFGIEDTRMAIVEARKQGIQPFCVTIDEKGNDYLPYIFGNDAFVVIRKPAELPRDLPLLYARITQHSV